MSERDETIFLRDILESIGKIERYTAGLSYDAFCGNDMVVDAVIRNFEVIGEAAVHVPDAWKSARNRDLRKTIFLRRLRSGPGRTRRSTSRESG